MQNITSNLIFTLVENSFKNKTIKWTLEGVYKLLWIKLRN